MKLQTLPKVAGGLCLSPDYLNQPFHRKERMIWKIYRKEHLMSIELLTLVGVIGTWIQAIVTVIILIIDLHKNKQENSNHPSPKV